MKTITFCLNVFLLLLPVSSARAQPATAVQLKDGFESGLSQWTYSGSKTTTIVTTEARTGTHSVRMYSGPSLTDEARRTELTPSGYKGTFYAGSEYCIKFGLKLKNWTGFPEWATVFQTHAVPADWSCLAGRDSVMLVVNADKRLNFHVVKRPKTVAASGIAIGDKVASHPVQLNTWNNYKLRYRPSFGSDGIIELWENGKKLYEQRGGNMDLLDSCGTPAKAKTYMKIGIYKEKGNLNSQELYYDDIEIAVGGNACGDTTYVMPAPTDLQTK